MTPDHLLACDAFPRAAKYHPEWIKASLSGGANSLWLAEWLAGAMDLRPGMRVLDLGCGRAASSIFLAREFGLQVWATDLWMSASESGRRIADAGLANQVFPIHADARELPFAGDFFDAIISIDAYFYFGTDDLYLNYLASFLKPGGQIGMAGAAILQEVDSEVPAHLKDWWAEDQPVCLHSAPWWRRHWQRSGIVNVEVADHMPDGWRRWLDWFHVIAPENAVEIAALEADQGRYMGYARIVGRRRPEARLLEKVTSLPSEYTPAPLLR
jgi:cyclopropane fatty-acyl-phospholipid synthase-like methyltransferase